MADPGERSLDDPAFGKHGEAMQFIALDDRQLPGAGLGDGGRGLLPPVPGISEDKLDEGEEAAASKPCGSSVEPPFEPLWRFDCR